MVERRRRTGLRRVLSGAFGDVHHGVFLWFHFVAKQVLSMAAVAVKAKRLGELTVNLAGQ